ncbi:MAG: signal peptidase I [Candidatus Liptonbacteria bacterium]|nr:signal peptidase I [Candidatus Liptonbacteria bacterium]
MRKFLVSLLEVFEIAFVAVGSVFLVRTFLVQPFVVSGSSMAPNLENGDYLLIDELTYRFRAPERGEVVVFRYQHNQATYFIKRIIGLPGERVQIKNNQISVTPQGATNPVALKELYLPPGVVTGGDAEYLLNDREYFVLGDNRSFSFDSRSWGFLEAKDMVGIARVRLWPLPQLQAFAAPQYSN